MQLKLRIDAANSLKANAATVVDSQKAAGRDFFCQLHFLLGGGF